MSSTKFFTQKNIVPGQFLYRKIVGILILMTSLAFVSCEDALIDSETYGSIQGLVQNDSTGTPVARASVTTSPATQAILSDEDGEFQLEDIPTGDYSISVRKKGYERTSVSVAVREHKTTYATILVTREENEADESAARVDITNWWNESGNDSVYVHAEYKIENTGSAEIEEYEITFRIESPRGEFFHSEKGVNLDAERNRIGGFEKYIRDEEADLVEVDNIWLRGPDK